MDVAGPVAAAINAWLAGIADAVLGPAVRAAAALVVSTPSLETVPAVVAAWRLMQGIANGLFVLAWAACGVLVMTDAGAGRFTAKLLVPRVVLAAVAANLSLHLAGALIALGNLLVRTVLAHPDADGAALLGGLLGAPASAHDVLGVLVSLTTAALAVVLVCVAVVRDLVLVVAVALAPLALATYALPQLDVVARTWVRLVVALVFAQLVQVVALEVGGAVIGRTDGTLFPASPLVAGVLAATLLYVLVRVPLIAVEVALRANVAVPLQPVAIGLRALRG
jgi:hypothetical protein